MKKILLILITVFIFSCKNEKTKPTKPNFIIGNWIRINNKKGSVTYETWNKNLKGLGYTLKEKDTAFKEKLSFVTLKDTLFLKVEGVNETPTLFRITNQTDTSFVAENKNNEFPKKILYYKDGQFLKAEVSSEDFKIEFIFKNTK